LSSFSATLWLVCSWHHFRLVHQAFRRACSLR
jgi:hypothetical protein